MITPRRLVIGKGDLILMPARSKVHVAPITARSTWAMARQRCIRARKTCAAAHAVRARVRGGCAGTHAPRSTTDSVRSRAANPRAADNITRVVVRDVKYGKNPVDSLSMPDFLPRRESDLAIWVREFNRILSAAPEEFGISIETAAELDSLVVAFLDQFKLTHQPDTRTSPAIAGKNTIMSKMIAKLREVAGLVRATCKKDGEKLITLGLRPNAGRGARIGVPREIPVVKVVSVIGRTVKVRLRTGESGTRAKPKRVAGAVVYSVVSDVPVDNMSKWTCHGNFTTNTFDLDFPDTLPPGTKVWITACWLSPRLKPGPGASPAYTWLSGGIGKFRNVSNSAA